jgi:hypothetical protein
MFFALFWFFGDFLSLGFFVFLFVPSEKRRQQFSRRRRFNEDEDINYINERNRVFNKKLKRFYDPYTSEIKNNLERGTAL